MEIFQVFLVLILECSILLKIFLCSWSLLLTLLHSFFFFLEMVYYQIIESYLLIFFTDFYLNFYLWNQDNIHFVGIYLNDLIKLKASITFSFPVT